MPRPSSAIHFPSANGNLLLSKVEDRRFWTQTVADEFVASALTFWIMYLDERPVSFSLTFDAGETKFILANLYDEQVKEHRTGNILACHVISRAVDQQCRYIDWGMGDSGYKKLWLARPGYGLHDVIAFPPWPMGNAFDWVMRRGFGFHAPMNGLAP